jgi:hypothetical protein
MLIQVVAVAFPLNGIVKCFGIIVGELLLVVVAAPRATDMEEIVRLLYC